MAPSLRPAPSQAPRDAPGLALEIAVGSPAGALTALEGGADRVELCVGLELGGLTPSQGLLEATVEIGLPVHALIRPRPGDFVFSPSEVDVMEREVRAAVASGAAGVVVGALRPDGTLDPIALERLVEAAGGRDVTLHRAIDQAQDPIVAASQLHGLGITRVLTSGGASRAGDGLATLARIVEVAGPVEVMAGGGVDVSDVPALRGLGVDAVHLSAKRTAERAGGSWVSLGSQATEAAGDSYFITDDSIVMAARKALDAVA
ncbi:copper homeostasis protein CutC [Frondihabitans australicus]|uniref:PF03932 family protein CutC n=1 Tax=Frondihabitans australicus TaxID=386892 RepID=A0A495ILT4_9MICO|nr:copper homeostasis protein CutC [Frondihabitans australicus]RKR76221.1 copper homeostasis protein CutC [Frondihabitans australicus]